MAKNSTAKKAIKIGEQEIVPWERFEDEVAEFMAKSIDQGSWGLDPKTAQVKRKPQYYSDKRKGLIKFDVSVEVRPAHSPEEILFLWLIECKDYPTRNVEVSEVEEFHDKMRQVSAHKGTMFTRVGFASGAANVAKGNRIGLATLQKEKFWSVQFSQDGGAFSEIQIRCPSYVDSNGTEYRSLTDVLKQTMSPFSIPVQKINLGEETIIFDGPFEVGPLDESDDSE